MRKIIGIFFLLFVLVGCNGDNKPTPTLNVDNLTLKVGEEKQLLVTLEHTDKKITYVVKDENVLSIAENGLVTGLKAGSTTVTVKVEGIDLSKTVTVTVTEEEQEIPVEISLTIDGPDLLKVGDQAKITVETNDKDFVTFETSDPTVVSIDKQGNIEALKKGSVTITATSVTDNKINKTLLISVYDNPVSSHDEEIKLALTEKRNISFESIFILVYESSDETVFTVTEGEMEALKEGNASLIVTIEELPDFRLEIPVAVCPKPTRVTVDVQTELVISETVEMLLNFSPLGSYSPMAYTSSDEEVVTVNELGEVLAVGLGKATVNIVSTVDERVARSVVFNVINKVVVKEDILEGEEVVTNGHTFKEGVNAFATVSEALLQEPIEIILVGTFLNPVNITAGNVYSGAEETLFKNTLTIEADDVTVQGFTFTSEGKIHVNEGLSNVVIKENIFKELTYTTPTIKALKQKNLEISYNTMTLNNNVGILVENPVDQVILIKGNQVTKASTAIKVSANTQYEKTLSLRVMWNKVDLSHTAFDINLAYQDTFAHALSYVRFNEATNYTFGAISSAVKLVDFNLNYWGGEPDYAKFTNLSESDLDGYYLDKANIVNENKYNSKAPAVVRILTEITEVSINDIIQVEIEILPREIPHNSVALVTSDSKIMTVNPDYTLNLLRSGMVDLILESKYDFSLKDKVTFEIITTPGIEIIPASVNNHLVVGNTLKLNTMVFPSKIQDKIVKFSVDNDALATINSEGLLNAKAAGLVTVRAELHDDPTVYQTFKVEIYASLNPENILDFISSSMITYTTPRKILMYGATNIWYESFESVSRIIFDTLEVNRSMMLPDCDTLSEQQRENCLLLRPGARPQIDAVTPYNDRNVHYVTVHETANTNPNAGAYTHAKYLIDQITGRIQLRQASWHYTMDDKELYQHIELDEMAWHAGDGRTKAGTTWTNKYGNTYIGGGNSHSVGIETSVARTDDILKIWQRTAKLCSQLAKEFNLPETQVKFHQDFSGKWCPQSMLRAELTWLFYEMVSYEYKLVHKYGDATLTFVSNDPEYVDNSGRVIKMPERAMNVSFTVTINYNGETFTKTYYSYLPGTVH